MLVRRYLIAGFLFLALGAAALAVWGAKPGAKEPARKTSALISAGQRRAAPDFVVQTVDGARFSLREARGRAVVVSFVTPYCLDCIQDVQAMKEAHEKLAGRGVEIVALDQGGLSDAEVGDYYRTQLGGAPHHYARDPDYRVASAFRVRATGTTVVVDVRGRIAYRDEGATSAKRLIGAVEEALTA